MEDFLNFISSSQAIPDERTKNWPVMDVRLVTAICVGYVVFIIIGKWVMEKQKAFDLRFIRVIHNAIMTGINFYMVVEILIQASKTSWYGPIYRSERGLGMARILWIFYVSKVLEFNDTVIMIFRKSFNQISFLHVYHHVSVFFVWWFNVMYYPGGEAYPSAWLNSFVHVWMYGYYLLATFGYQPWWKRYLTQLQITQLSLFVVQGITLLFTGATEFRWIGMVNGVYAFTILALFINFYVENYNKAKPKRG